MQVIIGPFAETVCIAVLCAWSVDSLEVILVVQSSVQSWPDPLSMSSATREPGYLRAAGILDLQGMNGVFDKIKHCKHLEFRGAINQLCSS